MVKTSTQRRSQRLNQQPPSLSLYEPSESESNPRKYDVTKMYGYRKLTRKETPTDEETRKLRIAAAATAAAMTPPKGGICDDMHNLAMRVGIDYDDVAFYAENDVEISALADAVLADDRQQNTVPRAHFGEKRTAPSYTSYGCKVFPKSNGGVRIVPGDSDSDSDSE